MKLAQIALVLASAIVISAVPHHPYGQSQSMTQESANHINGIDLPYAEYGTPFANPANLPDMDDDQNGFVQQHQMSEGAPFEDDEHETSFKFDGEDNKSGQSEEAEANLRTTGPQLTRQNGFRNNAIKINPLRRQLALKKPNQYQYLSKIDKEDKDEDEQWFPDSYSPNQ